MPGNPTLPGPQPPAPSTQQLHANRTSGGRRGSPEPGKHSWGEGNNSEGSASNRGEKLGRGRGWEGMQGREDRAGAGRKGGCSWESAVEPEVHCTQVSCQAGHFKVLALLFFVSLLTSANQTLSCPPGPVGSHLGREVGGKRLHSMEGNQFMGKDRNLETPRSGMTNRVLG